MTCEQYCRYAGEVLAPTEPLFLLVPKERTDWKPTERSFTAGQLMHHIAHSLKFNADGIGRNMWALPSMRHIFLANRKTPSSAAPEAVRYLRETSSLFLGVFASMEEEHFHNGMVDTPQLGAVPVWRAALFALEHHLNHKTELFMYLKLMGMAVTTKELYVGTRSDGVP